MSNIRCTFVGELHNVKKGSFTNQKGEEFVYYQAQFLTDDEYKPVVNMSISKDMFDLLSSDLADYKGISVFCKAEFRNQSKQVGSQWITVPKFIINHVEAYDPKIHSLYNV